MFVLRKSPLNYPYYPILAGAIEGCYTDIMHDETLRHNFRSLHVIIFYAPKERHFKITLSILFSFGYKTKFFPFQNSLKNLDQS